MSRPRDIAVAAAVARGVKPRAAVRVPPQPVVDRFRCPSCNLDKPRWTTLDGVTPTPAAIAFGSRHGPHWSA